MRRLLLRSVAWLFVAALLFWLTYEFVTPTLVLFWDWIVYHLS